jgi:hypothetical protein
MYADRWLVTMNPNWTKNMIFSSKLIKPLHPMLTLANESIDIVDQHDHLGAILLLINYRGGLIFLKFTKRLQKNLTYLNK